MSRLKNGFFIIMIGSGLLVGLIIVKAVTHNHFRNNALKWSEKSVDHSNLVKAENLKNLKTSILIIDLNAEHDIKSGNISSISVKPDEILEKSNLKTIMDFKGIKILASDDPSLSGRLWMLLSQMGIRELYILTE